jgi:ribosomal protein S18 acetylase RimI-like enzyme
VAVDLEIRAAVPADARAIARVHVASWRSGYRGLLSGKALEGLSIAAREKLWHERLADEEAQGRGLRIDVALHGASVLGFVAAGPSREQDSSPAPGEIYALYVHPECWSSGVGQALMASAVAHLAEAGAAEALLWVLASNMRARRFYELGDWRPDGRTRREPLVGLPDLETSVQEACYRRRLP